jgi:hypothetical protein
MLDPSLEGAIAAAKNDDCFPGGVHASIGELFGRIT